MKGLSLQDFILRSRSLKLYRGFHRAIRALRMQGQISGEEASRLFSEVRSRFDQTRDVDDTVYIRQMIQEGNRILEKMGSNAGALSEDDDSWQGQFRTDGGEKGLEDATRQDLKGRVGSNWPWGRAKKK